MQTARRLPRCGLCMRTAETPARAFVPSRCALLTSRRARLSFSHSPRSVSAFSVSPAVPALPRVRRSVVWLLCLRPPAQPGRRRLLSSVSAFTVAAAPATSASSSSSAGSASAAAAASVAEGSAVSPLSVGDGANDGPLCVWLLSVCGLVLLLVAVGGLTRLTRSGLSMTEWRPASGLPPLSAAAWERELERYRASPEGRTVNSGISLSDYRIIFLMEFAHRQLGRLTGLTFAAGLLYFGLRRRLSVRLLTRLSLVLAAGGAQAAIGWWMVRSGLEEQSLHQTAGGAVHVSPYRLCLHLLSAFAIYSVLLHTALQLRFPHSAAALQQLAAQPQMRSLRIAAAACTALVVLTIGTGAFVAGNEAGLCYNQFPLMGTGLVPPLHDLLSPALQPPYRNMFEFAPLVQLQHRAAAVSSVAAISVLWLWGRGRAGAVARRLGRRELLLALDAAALMAWLQAALGVSTLLLYVPVPLASLHQCGSIALLSCMIVLGHALGGRRAAPLIRAAAARRKAVARQAADSRGTGAL